MKAFVEECKRGAVMEAELAQIEKKGMPTGMFVAHPISGEKIPVWVGNYVLMGYGEGAVMGVPAHDERDFAFALKYGLPIPQVIQIGDGEVRRSPVVRLVRRERPGQCVNSGKYDGLGFQQAVDAIAADLKAKSLGEKQVQWRLRDWGISRQRYWGCPIPIVHCPACGDVPVPDEQLPVVLPEDLVPDGTGNPLAKLPAFYETKCPSCGKPAKRETDTMDTFVDSSWYFARYRLPGPGRARWSTSAPGTGWRWTSTSAASSTPSCTCSTRASSCARCATRACCDVAEPFTNLLTQGMVLAESYYTDANGRREWVNPADVALDARRQGQDPRRRRRRTARRWSTTASAPCRSRRTTASTRRR